MTHSMILNGLRLSILILLALLSTAIYASDESVELDQYFKSRNEYYLNQPQLIQIKNISADEIFRRTQNIVDYYRPEAEVNYQPHLDRIAVSTSSTQFSTLLRFLDPTSQFSRLFLREASQLKSFRDRDAKSVREYTVSTNPRATRPPLRLQGLRVALDPGHMGGDIWDTRTGKFVRTSTHKVSEGIIALQTAMLLEQKLKALGAEVLITHRQPGPATTTRWEDIDLDRFARKEIRSRIHEPWFLNLINNTSEQNLESTFDRSPEVRRLFSETMRRDYFAMREDLWARDIAMKTFRPDITLIIHFNASVNSPQANVRNKTFAYVPGGFFDTEFATGEARAHLLSHLSQGEQWNRSVDLSRKIVGEISSQLQVALSTSDGSGVRVENGVFARNLMMTRLNDYSAVSYLECLHYGQTAEFNRLINHDGGTLIIDGRSYGYSSRLTHLADAIVDGIKKYVAANP